VTLVTELKLGHLDVIGVPSSEYATIKGDARWKEVSSEAPGLNFYYIGLNCEKGVFTDRRVRRAAALAIDRDRIVATVREGQAVPAVGPIPPGVSGFDPTFRGVALDVAGAKRELAEAGIRPGTPIRLLQSDNKANLEVTQMVAAYLEQVGFKVKLVTHEWSTFKAKIDQGEFDAYYLNWVADYADGENFLYPIYHSARAGWGGNGPRYKNPEVDALLEKALATGGGREREALYRRIARIGVEDASRIFLFHKKDITVRQPWVRGYQQFPVFNSDRLTEIAIDESALGKV
jgi:peptide/nickel transport system substrate-binding protein/oligopeptide transport system substrate-binding protein